MRGTHNVKDENGVISGIIPAYAGNTNTEELAKLLDRDHPRVCGEHLMPAPPTLK